METAAEQQVTKTIDYFQEIWPALKVWGINLLVTLLILIIGLYLIKAVMKALDKAARQANADVTLARFMHSFVNIALYILLIFIVAGQLGINTASILAVLGTAGLAIAMSLKDSLSHFAGGILILFLRPFKVGDYIICSEGEGTIQEIGLVYTRVLTKDNKGLTIPNGKLAGISVTNASRMPERRLDITVGVSYDADLKKAKEIIENVYREVKGSCSILILTEDGIIAARDAWGRTPLVLGKKDGAMAVTSESTAFANLGYKIEAYIGPGEIVLLRANGYEQLRKPNPRKQVCSFLWVY